MTQVLDVTGLCRLTPGGSKLRLRVDAADGKALLRGHARSQRLNAQIAQTGRGADLIGFGWATVYLMTERMRTSLASSDLTGWFAQPVEFNSEALGRTIWLLGVEGTSGPTYSSAGNPLPGLPRLGEFLDPADWDGSDFFCPANWNGFLVTKRAADSLRKARLRNLYFECGSLEPRPNDAGDIRAHSGS
jgi:hypothetical protein